jgi:hypothetical protein
VVRLSAGDHSRPPDYREAVFEKRRELAPLKELERRDLPGGCNHISPPVRWQEHTKMRALQERFCRLLLVAAAGLSLGGCLEIATHPLNHQPRGEDRS